VLALCHAPAYASLPPGQIVPRLATQGAYIASEASFYRILREADEHHHRGRSRPPRPAAEPPRLVARAPNEVWTWDISWLPGPVKGLFFYLSLIVDLYSRKILGWEVYTRESAEYAAEVVRRAVLAEGCVDQPLVLHADNGSPLKGETLLETLYRLGMPPPLAVPVPVMIPPTPSRSFVPASTARPIPPRGLPAWRRPAPGCSSLCMATITNTALVVFAWLPPSSATAARIRPSLHSARPSMNRPEHVTPNAGQGRFVTGTPSLRSGSTPPLR